MFARFFKPKFYSKCKSCLNTIKTRLETIQKKRKAVQKFLKNDIAELLSCGLDYNAYGRAGGLLVEHNMSSCYELVEKFIGCLSNHIEELSKQKDCPDECKEAVQSLIYAAARFADLPELRELRTLFTEKFGNSLEPYINKEFVEKLRGDPPTKELKIQLLHDIAEECSIEWDSKALEQRLYRPPSLREEGPNHDPLNGSDHKKRSKNSDGTNPKTDNLYGRAFSAPIGEARDFLSQGRKNISDGSSEDETSTDVSTQDGPKASSSSVSEDEVENRPFYYRLVPPPYLKPKANKDESKLEKTMDSTALAEKDSNYHLPEPVVQEKPKPRSVRRRPLKAPVGDDSLSNPKSDAAAKRDPERTTAVEASKGHEGPTSLGPEMLSTAKNVHPKLPDYDDLATRLASLKGR